MGRHSASYLAAAQGLSTGPTAAGAAKYVGAVGGLALALGIGAAVASGTGIANATTDGTSTGAAGEGASSGPAADAAGLAHKLFSAPKLGSSDGGAALTGLVSGVQHKLAAAVDTGAASANKPVNSSFRIAPRGSSQRSSSPPSAPANQASSIVSAAANALRGGAQTFSSAPAPGAAPTGTPTPTPSLTTFAQPQLTVQQAATTPVTTLASGLFNSFNAAQSGSGGSPVSPGPIVLAALQLVRRDTTQPSFAPAASLPTIGSLFHPTPVVPPVIVDPRIPGQVSLAPHAPLPTDTAVVPGVGTVGTYMLQSDGSVSNYGGQPYQGETLDEPVNVIIVDPNSKSAAESQLKVNKDLALAGFPAQPVHSGGFKGTINGVTYGQKPAIPLTAYSDNSFLVQNDHGRLFGPAPAASGTGYVYTGAFSTETPTIYNGLPAHAYVSSNAARDALVLRLIATGQVSRVEYVPLNNAYNDGTTTTGDHDGYAVVITLK